MRSATRSCSIMQPHTAMSSDGLRRFTFFSAPMLPNTRSSACSRMAQVLNRIKSASSSFSVNSKPISESIPFMRSPSATFCWQPYVRTSAFGVPCIARTCMIAATSAVYSFCFCSSSAVTVISLSFKKHSPLSHADKLSAVSCHNDTEYTIPQIGMIRKAKSTVSQYLQFRNTYFPQYAKTAALKIKAAVKLIRLSLSCRPRCARRAHSSSFRQTRSASLP